MQFIAKNRKQIGHRNLCIQLKVNAIIKLSLSDD